jgi:serralysin
MPLASWTNSQVIAQLDSSLKWNGATITYSFPTSSAGLYVGGREGAGFVALNVTQQAASTLAFSLWDDLIAPDFVKVAPGTSWSSSNIEIGSSKSGVSYAHAYQPGVGSVWFNASYDASTGTNNLVTPQPGQHGFLTYIHELGHSLGLDHMGNYNGSTATPSSYQDSTVYSVMSYYGPSWGSGTGAGQGLVAWADWVGADGRLYTPQTPMVNDIMAIQAIYGVETTTRADNSVYGFHSNIVGAQRSLFDFSVNKNPILTIFDSAGNDTLDLSGYSTSSVIDLAPGAYSSCNSMTSNIALAYTCNMENAVGGAGNDIISGNRLANALYGGAGNDVLNGLDGNDTLDGGAGADTLNGGVGNDTYIVDNIGDRLVEGAGAGFDLAKTALAGYVLADNVEYLEFIGTGTTNFVGTGNNLANTITGGAGNDFVSGLAGNDVLNGSAGNDTLDGGVGADSMNGGVGNDTYIVDNVADVAIEAAGAGSDLVKTALASWALANNLEALEFTGTTNFVGMGNGLANTITGGAGNDMISGLAGNDALNGSAGNDTLDGGVGADRMNGGVGNDTYIVDNIADVVIEGAGAGSDLVKTALTSYMLSDNFEKLDFIGGGTIGFRGTGNALANVITGGAGNDTLDGGIGADELWGKAGADFFDFTAALGAGNVDVIKDFTTKDDTIRLENAVFMAFGAYTGSLGQGAFWTGSAAHDADDRVVFNPNTGALLYDADGSGVAQAVQFGTLDVAGLIGTVTSADFLFI